MWPAIAVAFVSTTLAVMSFISRGRAIKLAGELEAIHDEDEAIISALLEEVEALRLGDYGLDHDDMLDVLLPPHLRDDSVDAS